MYAMRAWPRLTSGRLTVKKKLKKTKKRQTRSMRGSLEKLNPIFLFTCAAFSSYNRTRWTSLWRVFRFLCVGACVCLWSNVFRTRKPYIQYSFISNRQVGSHNAVHYLNEKYEYSTMQQHLLIHNNNFSFSFSTWSHAHTDCHAWLLLLLHVYGKARTSNAFMQRLKSVLVEWIPHHHYSI